MDAFNDRNFLEAAKKFNEAEILFPQSEWAPKLLSWLHIHIIMMIIMMLRD